METNEKTMTPEESLQFITKSILYSKRNLKERSFYYIMWGWILTFASLFNYFLIRYLHNRELYENMYIKVTVSWAIFGAAGFIILFIYKMKAGKKEIVITHFDRFFIILWLSIAVVFALFILFCYYLEVYPTPYILALTGMATFVSGMIVRFTPLIIGGLLFAATSVVSVFIPGFHQLLLVAGSIILGYLIPGYLLRATKF